MPEVIEPNIQKNTKGDFLSLSRHFIFVCYFALPFPIIRVFSPTIGQETVVQTHVVDAATANIENNTLYKNILDMYL